MCLQPQRPGWNGRVDTGRVPPVDLVAAAMKLAVVPPTQRDSELIADLASEGSALSKSQVVGIRRLPAAD